MATVTATLVASGQPRAVQVVLSGLTPGEGYAVVGTTGDGSWQPVGASRWPVPGGAGVATGGQVVLVDNRAPLNIPVTYVMHHGSPGTVVASEPVTVPYPGESILQTLDGRTVIDFEWVDDGLPVELVIRSATFDVAGRSRPAVRFAVGGVGGGSMTIRTAPAATRALTEALTSGGPLVLRTNGEIRDLSAVEILLAKTATNALFEGEMGDGSWSWRTWVIGYLLVDDPEPSTVMAAFTWTDHDEAMARAGFTWPDFEDLFFPETWDDFDTYEWTQLAPGDAPAPAGLGQQPLGTSSLGGTS